MTRYLWLLLAALVGGCGTYATATPLNQPPHPMTPRAQETVEVFSSGPPARAHADVALLEVEQYDDGFDGGTPEILAKLRQKAGEMGCDGVVIGVLGASDLCAVKQAILNESPLAVGKPRGWIEYLSEHNQRVPDATRRL